MKKLYFLQILITTCLICSGQKKTFFDHIDLTFNVHIGGASIEKNSWPELFKEKNTAYQIDSFQYMDNGRICMIIPFVPAALSAGARISKYLSRDAEHKLLAKRIEWRSGLLVGSKIETTSFLTDRNIYQPPSAFPYRYKELSYSYRRSWVDFSNQVVYKIPSWLFRRNLKYYIGGGAGFTFELNSRVSEKFVQNLITQTGNTYTSIQEINTSRNEKPRTIASTYLNFVAGSELKCSGNIYFLFEGNYQGYLNSFSLNQKLYNDSGYFSIIFRYSF